MGGMFGSSGYKPQGTQDINLGLQRQIYGQMGEPDFDTFKGEFGEKSAGMGRKYKDFNNFDERARKAFDKLSPREKLQYTKPQQAPEYNQGMSGFDVGSTFREATGYDYTPESAQRLAEPYYAGIESQAIEGAKQGFQSGMDAATGQMGRRGLAHGGLGNMAMMDQSGALSRDIAGIRRDVGFQKAQDLSKLNQFDIQNMMQNRQFGAGLGEQQRQFSSQQQAQNMAQQQGMDQAEWARRYGVHRQPMDDLMNLYALHQGAPGHQPRSGWFGGLLGGAGSAMTGAGALWGGK